VCGCVYLVGLSGLYVYKNYTKWFCTPIYIGIILRTPMQNYSYIHRNKHCKIAYPYAKW